MAENDQLKIKSIYKSLVALRDSIDPKSGYTINHRVGYNYDQQIDELNTVTRNDYSNYKVAGVIDLGGMNDKSYAADEFIQIISQLIGLLEGQFDFDNKAETTAPIINIDNSNRNEIKISFKTIQQVITETDDSEIKQKLEELDNELSKDQKDTNKIKAVTSWLIEHAWEVFLATAPYLLERLGKSL